LTPIDVIKAALETRLVDEDGEPVSLSLQPPLDAKAVETLEKRIGVPLPDELRVLLSFCSGVEGCFDGIDFTGNTSFEQREIFPHGLPILADGFGNAWVLDLTSERTPTAPLFFACHDGPVILYQSPDLATFLGEVFKLYQSPHKSLIDDVHEDRLFHVWRRNPQVISHEAAMKSPDSAVATFASQLPRHFQIIDLRFVEPGMGFSWGRYGPKTELRRFGEQRIFAYAKPPKTGFFSKIFG
jgi:SMI1/KNR4 family protein SUKH-1